MHRSLIVAFIVVALLLVALASQWVTSLVLPACPSLHVLVTPPGWAPHLVYEQSLPSSGTHRQVRPLLITAFCLAVALFLLAVIHLSERAPIAESAQFACALFGKADTSRLPGSVPCDAPITRNAV